MGISDNDDVKATGVCMWCVPKEKAYGELGALDCSNTPTDQMLHETIFGVDDDDDDDDDDNDDAGGKSGNVTDYAKEDANPATNKTSESPPQIPDDPDVSK